MLFSISSTFSAFGVWYIPSSQQLQWIYAFSSISFTSMHNFFILLKIVVTIVNLYTARSDFLWMQFVLIESVFISINSFPWFHFLSIHCWYLSRVFGALNDVDICPSIQIVDLCYSVCNESRARFSCLVASTRCISMLSFKFINSNSYKRISLINYINYEDN